MKTPMRLLDCIDPALLQDLQNSLAESLGTSVSITDPHGNRLTAPGKRYAARAPGIPRQPPAANAEHFAIPELPPAAVLICTADACLGQWLIGNTPWRDDPPDMQSRVFVPVKKGRTTVAFLGFEAQTIRDWPPEALERFMDIAGVLTAKFGENTLRKQKRRMPPRVAVHGMPEPRPEFAL